MAVIGMVLLVIGAIVMLVGSIMVLIEAFKEHILWGLGFLFVPFVSIVFIVMHWNVSKKGFFIWLAGLPFYAIGIGLGVAGAQ